MSSGIATLAQSASSAGIYRLHLKSRYALSNQHLDETLECYDITEH
jgi:hypothetical protein